MSASELGRPLVLVAVALAASCAHEVTVPEPPDMTPLVASYGDPRGTFTPDDPGTLLDTAAAALVVLGGADPTPLLTALMASISQRLDGTGLGPGGESAPARVDAVLSVEIACPRDSGSIELTTVLEDNQLSRVLWGTANRCAIAGVTFDGSIAIYRYAALGARASEASFLLRVQGTVAAGGKKRAALDFRVRSGAVETRVPTPTGDVIVTRHGTDVAVRAANGTFLCSLMLRTCRRSA